MMAAQMANKKANFIEELRHFYCEIVGNRLMMEDMFYVYEDKTQEEFVHVVFSEGEQKRFSVSGDNEQGMLFDFTKFILNYDDYPWLEEDMKR